MDTPLNPMATPVFPEQPERLTGTSVWVLQMHKSGRSPIWNGPMPDEFAADAIIAHVNDMKHKTDEEFKVEGYDDAEIAVFKDISQLLKYRAEVILMPLGKQVQSPTSRPMGFQLPDRKEDA